MWWWNHWTKLWLQVYHESMWSTLLMISQAHEDSKLTSAPSGGGGKRSKQTSAVPTDRPKYTEVSVKAYRPYRVRWNVYICTYICMLVLAQCACHLYIICPQHYVCEHPILNRVKVVSETDCTSRSKSWMAISTSHSMTIDIYTDHVYTYGMTSGNHYSACSLK